MIYKNFTSIEKAEKYLGTMVKDSKGNEWKVIEFYMTPGDVVAMRIESKDGKTTREVYDHIEFVNENGHPLGEIAIDVMKSHIKDFLALASYSHYEATHDDTLPEPLRKLLLERTNAIHALVRNEELIIKEAEKIEERLSSPKES